MKKVTPIAFLCAASLLLGAGCVNPFEPMETAPATVPTPAPSVDTTSTPPVALTPEMSTLFVSKEGHFRFAAPTACISQFKIVQSPPVKGQAGRMFDVYATKSSTWKADKKWYTYLLMSQKEYNITPDNQAPGKPTIDKQLDADWLVAHFAPQDGPTDLPAGCMLSVERN